MLHFEYLFNFLYYSSTLEMEPCSEGNFVHTSRNMLV